MGRRVLSSPASNTGRPRNACGLILIDTTDYHQIGACRGIDATSDDPVLYPLLSIARRLASSAPMDDRGIASALPRSELDIIRDPAHVSWPLPRFLTPKSNYPDPSRLDQSRLTVSLAVPVSPSPFGLWAHCGLS